MAKDAGDGQENGEQNNTVEMDVEEHEDPNQDTSSEDESANCQAKPLIQEGSVIKTVCVGNLETEQMRVFLQRQRGAHQKSQVPELPKQTGCGDAVHGSKILSRGLSMLSLRYNFFITPFCKGSV